MDLIRPDWPAPARVQACFTSRQGGVSDGAFAGLNLGAHVDDDPQRVAEIVARLDGAHEVGLRAQDVERGLLPVGELVVGRGEGVDVAGQLADLDGADVRRRPGGAVALPLSPHDVAQPVERAGQGPRRAPPHDDGEREGTKGGG